MSKITKQRLDILISNKFELELSEADFQIRIGNVLVNGNKEILPSLKFRPDIKLDLINQKEFVSRGAYKLKKAIEEFKIIPKDFVCVDIGSSTGGFVQILLLNGAKKVYAVDVGFDQLHYTLKNDNRVINMEKTNLKTLTKTSFAENIDLVVTDVSFISLKHVFEVCKDFLASKKQIVALIKPQFEASSKYVSEGGYVEEQHHEFLINRVIEYAKECSFKFLAIEKSPILGNKSKNIEYISLFEKE
ncbi:TlyA family RNA methyltransferase [Mycoplasma sp. 4044]